MKTPTHVESKAGVPEARHQFIAPAAAFVFAKGDALALVALAGIVLVLEVLR